MKKLFLSLLCISLYATSAHAAGIATSHRGPSTAQVGGATKKTPSINGNAVRLKR